MSAAKKKMVTAFTVCALLMTCIVASCGNVPTAPAENPPNCIVINGVIYCE